MPHLGSLFPRIIRCNEDALVVDGIDIASHAVCLLVICDMSVTLRLQYVAIVPVNLENYKAIMIASSVLVNAGHSEKDGVPQGSHLL